MPLELVPRGPRRLGQVHAPPASGRLGGLCLGERRRRSRPQPHQRRLVARGRGPPAPASGAPAGRLDLVVERRPPPPLSAAMPCLEDRGRAARRGHLVEAGPAEGVVPRLADRPVPVVLRAGRCALAGEAVVRVEAEQAAVPVDPGDGVVDRDRRPGAVAAGPDRQPVGPPVVDEPDVERALQLRREVAGVGLTERVAPEPAEGGQRAAKAGDAGNRGGREVVAALEVGRVRPAAGVDDRVRPVLVQRRVVPAAPQVVADVVVGRAGDPDRDGALGRVVEEDEELLPVRLVVVGAGERRAPVVHRVEEHVVEDDPAVPPQDAGVVDVAGRRPRGSPRT